MNPMPQAVAQLEHALEVIELASASLDDTGSIPFYTPTALSQLPAEEREAAQTLEARAYRERPEQSAAHFCLLAATEALQVAHSLLTHEAAGTPQEREHAWNALIAQTKQSGRAAYRAALVLTDTKRAA